MSDIVLGDLHIGVKNSSKTYLKVAIDLSKQIVAHAESIGATRLFQVGDLFDNRKALTHDAIEAANEIIDRFNSYFDVTYLIVGNHDTSKKDVLFPHSLSIFRKFPNVNIVEKPQLTEDGILLLPWLFDMSDMVPANICMGHFDINGAVMNTSGTISKNHLLNFSDFSKYKMTVSGHYHTPKLYQHNVRYVGSPYQITHNDSGRRGFWVLDFDFEDNGMEFVEFNDYPHHFSFTDKSISNDDIEGHIVRLTFTESHGIDGDKAIIEKLRSRNPYSLTVKYANISDGMTEDTISEAVMVKDKLDILFDFYDKSTLPEGIDLVTLKKVTRLIKQGDESNG